MTSSPRQTDTTDARRDGFTMIPDSIMRRRDLSNGGKLLWGRIARYASAGSAFPRLATLATEIGLGRSQVIRYLHEIEEKRLLRVDRRSGCRNQYVPVAETQPVPLSQPVPLLHATGSTSATGVVPLLQRASEETTDETRRRHRDTATFSVPESLTSKLGWSEAWAGYQEHRRRIRAALSPLAAKTILAELARRPDEAVAALGQAAASGWRGFRWEWLDRQKDAGVRDKRNPHLQVDDDPAASWEKTR